MFNKLLVNKNNITITGLDILSAKELYEYFRDKDGAEIRYNGTKECDVTIWFRATEMNQKLIDCFSKEDLNKIEDSLQEKFV